MSEKVITVPSKKPKKSGAKPAVDVAYFSELASDLKMYSDREACILAISLLDQAITLALQTRFVGERGEAESRLLSSQGPLGSFGAKTDLAKVLGLISEPLVVELSNLRRIRNDFAHEITRHSLDEPSIAAKCAMLKLPTLASTTEGLAALSDDLHEDGGGFALQRRTGETVDLTGYMYSVDERGVVGFWTPRPKDAHEPRSRFIESAQVCFFLLMKIAIPRITEPATDTPSALTPASSDQ